MVCFQMIRCIVSEQIKAKDIINKTLRPGGLALTNGQSIRQRGRDARKMPIPQGKVVGEVRN